MEYFHMPLSYLIAPERKKHRSKPVEHLIQSTD